MRQTPTRGRRLSSCLVARAGVCPMSQGDPADQRFSKACGEHESRKNLRLNAPAPTCRTDEHCRRAGFAWEATCRSSSLSPAKHTPRRLEQDRALAFRSPRAIRDRGAVFGLIDGTSLTFSFVVVHHGLLAQVACLDCRRQAQQPQRLPRPYLGHACRQRRAQDPEAAPCFEAHRPPPSHAFNALASCGSLRRR